MFLVSIITFYSSILGFLGFLDKTKDPHIFPLVSDWPPILYTSVSYQHKWKKKKLKTQ